MTKNVLPRPFNIHKMCTINVFQDFFLPSVHVQHNVQFRGSRTLLPLSAVREVVRGLDLDDRCLIVTIYRIVESSNDYIQSICSM